MKVKLGDLVEFSNGYAFKSSDYVDCSNTVNCRMSNIRPDGSFDIEYNIKFLPDEFSDKYNDFILKDGDIIIAMTDMAGDPKILGVPTIVNTKGYTVLMNQRVGKLALKGELIIPQYLKYTLISKPARDYFKSFAGGGVQLNIGKKEILNIELNLHNLEEQTEIVNRLDKIKIIIKFRKQQLQQLDDLVKARFVEMFGDIHESSKWVKKPWSELVTIQNGRDYKNLLVESGGYPVYGTGGEMARASDYLCPENSIIVGRKGTINNPLLVKEKFWNVDTAFGVIVGNQLHYQYFYNFCRMFDFSTLNKQAVLPSTTKADLLKIQIAVPPIELQNEFATFVEQIDKSKATVQKALDEAQTLFDSLMQEYFG